MTRRMDEKHIRRCVKITAAAARMLIEQNRLSENPSGDDSGGVGQRERGFDGATKSQDYPR